MNEEIFNIVTDKPMTYEEAVAYFSEKLTLTPDEFVKLRDVYKTLAFTVSGYTSLQIIKTFQERLTEAIENGSTIKDFKAAMNDFLEKEGYAALSGYQADNIFRTNIQTAYNVGAYQEMTSAGALKARPYWMYNAVDDEKTRPTHRAMNGKVFPADSDVWDVWYPPNGFRCRCSVSTLSKRQVEQMGLVVEAEMPERVEYGGNVYTVLPDQDFKTNPAKIQFDPHLQEFPQTLIRAFERRQKENTT